MKLYYRGLSYEHKSPLHQSEATIKASHPTYGKSEHMRCKLTYRGLNYDVNPNQKLQRASLHQKTHELMYRGVAYWKPNVEIIFDKQCFSH